MTGQSKLNINYNENWTNALLSSFRGYRNGVIAGARIRFPYIFQAVIYCLLYSKEKYYRTRVTEVMKHMFHHGRNLGTFILLYKTMCFLCRRYLNMTNGIESVLCGFIGGSIAFGDSSGISGSVNNQIILYLFARALEGMITWGSDAKIIPEVLDVRTPNGFRIFAGLTSALTIFLTEYKSGVLKSAFYRTMHHLYYDSDSGSAKIPNNFLLFVMIISASLLIGDTFGVKQLQLDSIMGQSEKVVQYVMSLLFGEVAPKK